MIKIIIVIRIIIIKSVIIIMIIVIIIIIMIVVIMMIITVMIKIILIKIILTMRTMIVLFYMTITSAGESALRRSCLLAITSRGTLLKRSCIKLGDELINR